MVRKSNIVNKELGIVLDILVSYNPVIITNKEAHTIFGNMNKESGGSSQTANTGNEWVTRISDYLSKSGQPTISGTDRPDMAPDYPVETH